MALRPHPPSAETPFHSCTRSPLPDWSCDRYQMRCVRQAKAAPLDVRAQNIVAGTTERRATIGVADDAVSSEPVWASNSLVTGKSTGNFAVLGPIAGFPQLISWRNQHLAAKFPTQPSREVLFPRREFQRRTRER